MTATHRIVFVLLTALWLGSGAARAENSNVLYEAIVRAPVGSWAEYTLSSFNGDKRTQRYALVERSATKMVLEMTMGEIVMRFEYAPSGSETWRRVRGLVRIGNGKTATLAPAGQPLLIKGLGLGALLGSESLTTPAGHFDCKHWRKQITLGATDSAGEFWSDEAVAPIGLVRSHFADIGLDMQLTAVGTGAKAQLTAP